MGLFGKKKKSDTIDFTRMSDAQIPRVNKDYKMDSGAVDLRGNRSTSVVTNSKNDVVNPFAGVNDSTAQTQRSNSDSGGMFGFLDNPSTTASTQSSTSSYPSSNIINEVSEISELKTHMRKLSGQIEGHSNEVYRLMQRIELLEKKIQRFENR
jgi:hypothetical protein